MKKVLSIILVAVMLTASLAGAAFAAEAEEPEGAYYIYTSGTVTAIEERDDQTRVTIAVPDEDREATSVLVLTDRTVFPFESEIEIGDYVTAYYIANAPMILIYPPQFNVAVLVNGKPASQSVVVDRFAQIDGQDGRYLAHGGNLIINVGPDTEVVLADGTEFNFDYGPIDGRRLIVIYSVETRSLPPMTTPEKIIVLFEDAVTGPLPIDPDMVPDVPVTTLPAPIPEVPVTTLPAPVPTAPITILPAPVNVLQDPILVNGTVITAPNAFMLDGMVMVPLRAIAQELGYEVNWDTTLKSVRLGVAIHVWVGSTEVHIGRMAPQTISQAPVIVGSSTFVPLDFFRVIGVNNAYSFEGQIVIDNINERME